jgi:lipoprotein-releasing system permease protein
MDALIGVWQALQTLGGSLSAIFIAVIGLLLVALAVVYLGAALVVLARFAREARRPGPRWLAAALMSLIVGSLVVRMQWPELSLAPWSDWLVALGRTLLGVVPLCALAVGLTRVALRVSPRTWPVGVLLVAAAGLGVFAQVVMAGQGTAGVLASAVTGAVVAVLLGLLPLALAGLMEIRRSVEWFIATRYLVAERRQAFISAITLICIGAVAAGVWLIITVLSVMNGFERTWRDEIVGNYAHFLVRSYYGQIIGYDEVFEQVKGAEGVLAASPYLDAEGMIRVTGGRIAPVRLRGIEPSTAAQVTRLSDKIVAGELSALDGELARADLEARRPPSLILGKVLADELEVGVADEVILISPFGGPSTALGPSPRLMKFRVVGLFESSFLQYDELFAFTGLPSAQAFMGLGNVIDGFEVKSVDFYRSRQVALGLEDELGYPFFSRDWKDLFPQFFHALNSNRSMMFMLLIMIMVVSAFVIVVTLMMMIMAKSSDVAILKTMGARDESIELIFAIEGTLIGLGGVGVGVLSGMAVSTQLAWIQTRIEQITGVDTLPSSVYQISTLPSEVDPLQVFGVVTIALVLALGATLLPSRHGSRLDPVERLRDD